MEKRKILFGLVGIVVMLFLWRLDISRADNNYFEEVRISENKKETQVLLMIIKVPSGYPYPSSWQIEKIAEELGMDVEKLVELNNLSGSIVPAGEILIIEPYTENNQVLVSWYGPGFHGRKMANGEVFNMYDPTIVAHKFLPFGTRVRLSRVDNGKSIEVIVKDRGPFVPGRHFDLSYAAAKKLEMVEDGVVKCKVEILDWPH